MKKNPKIIVKDLGKLSSQMADLTSKMLHIKTELGIKKLGNTCKEFPIKF